MNKSYYVYGTFIEKVRYKFKSKEDAIKFEKYARKECRTSFNWLFYDNDSLREEIETDKDECLGLYDHYNQCQNVAKESFHISKPIKSNSTFSLVQTITDQLLLIVNGTVSQPILRIWHISKKDDAIEEFNRITRK